jgi:hypothetical protein
VGTICLCLILDDYRIAFIAGSGCPSIVGILLSDALPPRLRKHTAKLGMTSGIIGMMTLVAALYFNWVDVQPLSFKLGFITVSMASLATSSLLNVMLFFCKCIVSSIRFESTFVIIKSRMEVIPTTKELADVFMASNELLNSKAAALRTKKGILSFHQ